MVGAGGVSHTQDPLEFTVFFFKVIQNLQMLKSTTQLVQHMRSVNKKQKTWAFNPQCIVLQFDECYADRTDDNPFALANEVSFWYNWMQRWKEVSLEAEEVEKQTAKPSRIGKTVDPRHRRLTSGSTRFVLSTQCAYRFNEVSCR